MAERRTVFLDTTQSKSCAHCGMTFYRDKRNTWAHWNRAKYCGRVCAGAAIAAAKLEKRPPLAEAFAKWFTPSGGCWEWQGAIDRDGYGIFSYAGKTARAARMALSLSGRPLASGEFACHHCDNPRCVRPDHLFVGTNTDNMRDMVAKGRNPDRWGENNPNYRHGQTAKGRPDG